MLGIRLAPEPTWGRGRALVLRLLVSYAMASVGCRGEPRQDDTQSGADRGADMALLRTAHCPSASLTMKCPERITPQVCPPPPQPLSCPPAPPLQRPLRVLIFNRDLVWKHPSNCVAAQNLARCGVERGWTVSTTEDPAIFSPAGLAAFDVVVFSMTSGNVFATLDQQLAFRSFIEAGKGFVGIHSASYTQTDWPWFVALVGATVKDHPPDMLPGSLLLDDPLSPINAGLPSPWIHCEELYTFQSNPADVPGLQPLISLDEDCPLYPDPLRLGRHPLSWHQSYGGGRSFYTALGHHQAAYSDPLVLGHMLSGIAWTGYQ